METLLLFWCTNNAGGSDGDHFVFANKSFVL